MKYSRRKNVVNTKKVAFEVESRGAGWEIGEVWEVWEAWGCRGDNLDFTLAGRAGSKYGKDVASAGERICRNAGGFACGGEGDE